MKYHFQPYLTRLEHIMEQPQQTLFLPTDLQIEELEQRQVMAAAADCGCSCSCDCTSCSCIIRF